jgi:hypothetical protein
VVNGLHRFESHVSGFALDLTATKSAPSGKTFRLLLDAESLNVICFVLVRPGTFAAIRLFVLFELRFLVQVELPHRRAVFIHDFLVQV